MSFIADHVQHIYTQLELIQIHESSPLSSPSVDPKFISHSTAADFQTQQNAAKSLEHLRSCVRVISSHPSRRSKSTLKLVLETLGAADLSHAQTRRSADEKEMEWMLISKATLHIYNYTLTLLFKHILQLEQNIRYWESVIRSYLCTGLYSIQISPFKAWQLGVNTYSTTFSQNIAMPAQSFTASWHSFYRRIHEVIREKSLNRVKSTTISSFTILRGDIRKKLTGLRRLREIKAVSLGVLMGDVLAFEVDDRALSTSSENLRARMGPRDWKVVVARSITLMEAVLRRGNETTLLPFEFEKLIYSDIEFGGRLKDHVSQTAICHLLSERLCIMIQSTVPSHVSATETAIKTHGRPSAMTRYWLPITVFLFSSTTLLQVFFSRRVQLQNWVTEAVETASDFWSNWILEPIGKIIGTIRHNENSEVALMSKGSLKGDRESLGRMVQEFARDGDKALTEAQLADIHHQVKEGDLTPVLKAYEKDMRHPLVGTVRGNLIRALLIQVQKTKVDIEVAVSGIDALLKSQELVFGFIGVTPGVIVCIVSFRWISEILGKCRSTVSSKRRSWRSLRNIDKILSDAQQTGSAHGMLSNKEHGLLLCELESFRQGTSEVLPKDLAKDLLDDIGQLLNISTGVPHQLRLVERIRWTYASYQS